MQCNDEFQDAREYNNNDNDNYFDVFDTRHINVQAQIHNDSHFVNANENANPDDNAIYNLSNNYKLYFDDEYHNEYNFQRLNVNNYYQRVSKLN